MVQLVVLQRVSAALSTPLHVIEEDVDTRLLLLVDQNWVLSDGSIVGKVDEGRCGRVLVGFTCILLQPHPQHLVPTPITERELSSGQLLVKISWLSEEDLEERFYGNN